MFLFFPITVMYRTLANLSEEVRMDQTRAGRSRNWTRLVTRQSHVPARRRQSDEEATEELNRCVRHGRELDRREKNLW